MNRDWHLATTLSKHVVAAIYAQNREPLRLQLLDDFLPVHGSIIYHKRYIATPTAGIR